MGYGPGVAGHGSKTGRRKVLWSGGFAENGCFVARKGVRCLLWGEPGRGQKKTGCRGFPKWRGRRAGVAWTRGYG